MSYVTFDDNINLNCPECDQSNLHQERVEVMFREKEDGNGFCSTSTRDSIDTKLYVGGIKGRRDIINIYFYCEHCNIKKYIEIKQHKGTTEFTWCEV